MSQFFRKGGIALNNTDVYKRQVAPHSPTSLLTFQKEQLEEIAEACNMEVVGTTQVISDGKMCIRDRQSIL